jgi:2-polyprenyl-6-methoxyphenol hydroxylase-like FAD-dependent oxidoreductase
MAEEQQHVAIVGGGLAVRYSFRRLIIFNMSTFKLILEGNHKGMALALALANHGTLIPTIYELRDEEDNRGANIALAPNGLRVLHHIGVYDRIRTKGFNFETVTTYNAQGQNLGSFLNGSERHYEFSALRIHRSLVLKGLLDEVKAQGILIHNNMKLLSIEEETDSGAKLKFENGQTVEADFVIGADGIYSKVRPYITDVELVYSGSIGIIGLSVPKDQLHENHKSISFPAFTFGKSGFVAMLPSNYDGSVVDFFSTFPFPSQDREYWDDFMKRKDKQQKMLIERFGGGDWPAHITRVVKEQARENLNGHP